MPLLEADEVTVVSTVTVRSSVNRIRLCVACALSPCQAGTQVPLRLFTSISFDPTVGCRSR